MTETGFQVCSSIQMKPVPVAGFIFSNESSANPVPNLYFYRPPKLKKQKKFWYIEYYYRIPVTARHLYDNKEWYRFRIKEDINRRTGRDRELYAEWLLSEITNSLRNGYNPFTTEIEQSEEGEIPEEISANEALQLFLDKWKGRGLAKETMAKYTRYVQRLMDWLNSKQMLHADVRKIKVDHIEAFLSHNKKLYNYGNREYNNAHDFVRTAFNYLLKKKFIDQSPMVGIDKLKAKSSKHRFYDEASLKAITAALLATDTYTYLAAQTVYYLCVRSEKELKNLRVGNIQWEQNMILAEADGTKGGAGRYIPMDENIKKLFLDQGVDKYPAEFYVFGIHGHPSKKPFGKGFFSKRFRRVCNAAGLPSHFSLYGFKHTRIIHLKSDNVSDANIMYVTGHKDFGAYSKYMRDMNLTVDMKTLNEKSRKI